MSVDLPRRGRRSSISEHIHSVFHVDRPDKVSGLVTVLEAVIDSSKKRENIHRDGPSGQPSTSAPKQPVKGSHSSNPEAAISNLTPAGSLCSYSWKSGQPTSSNLRSSPPFSPVASKDDPDFLPQLVASFETERDLNCSSPTWHKDNARKERRATKRLEADRKDLEERLLRLEANQARLEHGIYERNPRRLTKEQPLGSTRRSSSAFSALFSGSKRSSRSSVSSVNGTDADSRRYSSDTPPTLSLTLPERFGTAVSRELATRHGTFLLSSHRAHQTIHAMPKSDDLRENWKAAEAWQRNYAGLSLNGTPGQPSELDRDDRSVACNMARTDEPQSRLQGGAGSADLDRGLFTASLRHTGKPLPPKPTTTAWSSIHDEALESNLRLSKHDPNTQSQPTDSMPTRVATARQLRELPPRESVPTSSGNSQSQNVQPSMTRFMPSQESQEKSASQMDSKVYKSSPLASNPSNTNNPGSKVESRVLAVKHGTHSETASKSPHPSLSAQHGQTESKNHLLTPVHSERLKDFAGNRAKQPVQDSRSEYSIRQAANESPKPTPNDRDWTPGEIRKSPKKTHVLEHTGRSVSLTDKVQGFMANGNHQSPETKGDPAPNDMRDSTYQNDPRTEGDSGAKPDLSCLNSTARSRSLSDSSSQASYNTAEEEILQVPQPHRDDIQSNVSMGSPKVSTADALQVNKRTANRAEMQNNSQAPLARDRPVTMLRRKPKQKVNAPLQDQMVAKVFVICCRCKYWHDMPSEVYAKLACPERLPSDSLLARTFTRRNSVSHRSSLRNSLFSADPSEYWRLPTPRQLPNSNRSQEARVSKAAAGAPLKPPSCCWCGHNMSRTCCQGWTTLVQMRERHH